MMSKPVLFYTLICAIISLVATASLPCSPRSFNRSSIVCVCNATYCDTQEPLSDVTVGPGQYYHVVSTKAGKRFESSVVDVTVEQQQQGQGAEAEADAAAALPKAQLIIDRQVKYQKMIGFGGAFTDSSGINLNEMSAGLRDKIMKSYFNTDGLEYNVQRVPIGGTDFSDRNYTLCDVQGSSDDELANFGLTMEDHEYKIPYIKQAQLMQPNLKLFASPWSAPPWMKTSESIKDGLLKDEYYQLWADYFVKFLDEYRSNGITYWGLTPQNEPVHGSLIPGEWNSMGWFAAGQRDFIKYNLGPSLADAYSHVKLMIMDDQRFQLVPWTRTILGDSEAAKYVSGIALHWYSNFYFTPEVMNIAHSEFPDYFMLNTEACTGYLHFIPGIDHVVLGSWERAEYYAHNIIEDLNHWLSGWVEWNLVLDVDGGPNWANNQVDAPVIFDREKDEAYKQPMYYALGHFSKYITENSTRIYNSGGMNLNGLQILTVLRPDNMVVAVVYNKQNFVVPLYIQDSEGGNVRVEIEAKSIHTLVYSDLTPATESTGSPTTEPSTGSGSTLKIHARIIIFVLSVLCILQN